MSPTSAMLHLVSVHSFIELTRVQLCDTLECCLEKVNMPAQLHN
uniref:Uncharacterized protein n=1 Tax=Arundo donax TaxID=35708 RepID=A0A0A9F025_ARUDO